MLKGMEIHEAVLRVHFEQYFKAQSSHTAPVSPGRAGGSIILRLHRKETGQRVTESGDLPGYNGDYAEYFQLTHGLKT